jgi:hypothetical protein
MQSYIAGFGQWVTVIQGAIFVACVLLFRRGVVGEISHFLKIRLWSKTARQGRAVRPGFLIRYFVTVTGVPMWTRL